MRAEIIELARELGLPMTVNAEISHSTGIGLSWKYSQVNRWNFRGENNPITPEEFIARMRVTASIPKPEMIDGCTVEYHAGYIKVGCTNVPNDVVRAIHKKLVE